MCVNVVYCTFEGRLTIWIHILKNVCPVFLSWPMSDLLLQAKLSILLATLLLACYCYWLMERRLADKKAYRLPRIPRPRHKVTNHRILNSRLNFDSIKADVPVCQCLTCKAQNLNVLMYVSFHGWQKHYIDNEIERNKTHLFNLKSR